MDTNRIIESAVHVPLVGVNNVMPHAHDSKRHSTSIC